MIALKLTDIKDFMNKLLKSETFDHFLLQEATISSGATYQIDGRINKGFYSEEEAEEMGLVGYDMLPFSYLRGNCFDLIKGKRTPAAFKFVFLLSPENLRKTIASAGSPFTNNDISGAFINLTYHNQILSITTGISYNIFSLDKSLEQYWDQALCKFLKLHGIEFEEF